MLAVALWALVVAAWALAPPSAHAAQRRTPTLAPANTVIDGPSADITGLGGLAVARDGTGGLVYLRKVQGVAHVFVSRLLSGQFAAPQQVDVGLAGASSQPVIAAADTGLLVVAFVNGGTLYALQAPNGLSAFTAPSGLVAGASSPALSITPLGKAYLAFTAVHGTGTDVRCAYYYQGQWAVAPAPLNAGTPGDGAGSGTGRPSVAAAGDGVGIVAWGEGGHVFTRRIWGTSPSAVNEQADTGSLVGWSEVSADQPVISSGGDSSYAAVAFRETFTNSSVTQSRVLMNRLHSSRYDGIAQVDGMPVGGDSADQPQVAVTEFGRGFVTSGDVQSHDVLATPLAGTETVTLAVRLNSQVNAAAPDAVPAVAGTISTMVAWQQVPGVTGPAEIRLRYATDGSDLNPEQVLSQPTLGPVNADRGLAAGGDLAGDAAVAWVQGSGSGTQIVAAQLYQAPGSFVPATAFSYQTNAQPGLGWSTSSELWGAPHYLVALDGAQIADTTATGTGTPAPLGNGPHTWQVTAVNQVGLSTTARAATVFVDTIAPRASFAITGRRHVHATVHISVRTSDAPPGLPAADGSGVKTVQVKWGDGSKYFISHGKFHVYKRRRRYLVTVIVKDRAGNRTVVTRRIKITTKSNHTNSKPKKHSRKAAARTHAGSPRRGHSR